LTLFDVITDCFSVVLKHPAIHREGNDSRILAQCFAIGLERAIWCAVRISQNGGNIVFCWVSYTVGKRHILEYHDFASRGFAPQRNAGFGTGTDLGPRDRLAAL